MRWLTEQQIDHDAPVASMKYIQETFPSVTKNGICDKIETLSLVWRRKYPNKYEEKRAKSNLFGTNTSALPRTPCGFLYTRLLGRHELERFYSASRRNTQYTCQRRGLPPPRYWLKTTYTHTRGAIDWLYLSQQYVQILVVVDDSLQLSTPNLAAALALPYSFIGKCVPHNVCAVGSFFVEGEDSAQYCVP